MSNVLPIICTYLIFITWCRLTVLMRGFSCQNNNPLHFISKSHFCVFLFISFALFIEKPDHLQNCQF